MHTLVPLSPLLRVSPASIAPGARCCRSDTSSSFFPPPPSFKRAWACTGPSCPGRNVHVGGCDVADAQSTCNPPFLHRRATCSRAINPPTVIVRHPDRSIEHYICRSRRFCPRDLASDTWSCCQSLVHTVSDSCAILCTGAGQGSASARYCVVPGYCHRGCREARWFRTGAL